MKLSHMPEKEEHYNYDDEIDLREIFNTLGRRKWIIIIVTTVFVMSAGVISWFFIDPIYEAKTTIAVTQPQIQKQSIGNIEDVVNQLGDVPLITPESTVVQIKSPGIFQSTIDRLSLPYTKRQLQAMVTAEQINKTNLVQIVVSNGNAGVAAEIANTIREEFLLHVNRINEQKLSRSLEMMQDNWLNEEMEGLKAANNKLREHKLKSRSIDFLNAQLAGKNEDLANVQSQLLYAEIERKKLQSGIAQAGENLKNTPQTLPTVSTADGVIPVEMQGIEIRNGRVVSENLNDAYTKVLNEYNSKLTDLAETDAEIAQIGHKVKQLEEQIRVMEAELIKNQIEEKTLQDEIQRRENVIQVLNTKIAEVKMTEAMDLAGNTILTVSPAVPPDSPVKPNKVLNMAIAGVLGLMLSIFGVFLAEYLRKEEDIDTPQGA